MTAVVRSATLEDVSALATLGATTFRDSYEVMIGRETTEPYILANFDEATTLSQFTDPRYTYLVAQDGPELIGYSALVRTTPHESVSGASPLQMRRLYVSAQTHRTGVGTLMMGAAIEAAKKNGHDAIWLTVWQRNERAIQFYLARQFEIVGTAPFHMSEKVMNDHVMRRAI